MADCYFHGYSFSGACHQCDEEERTSVASATAEEKPSSVAERIKTDPAYRDAVRRVADEQFRLPD